MSGTVTITPGYEFPSDSTAITKARLNLLANPTAQVAAGAITARELSSTILPFDPTIQTIFFEDFMVDNGLSGVIGANNLRTLASGASAAVTIAASTATNPGQVQFAEGVDATASAGIRGNSATLSAVVLGGGKIEITWLIGKLANLSSGGADTYNLWIGLGNGATTMAEPTSGVYFAYTHGTNSGQWVGRTAKASVYGSVNSSIAVATNTWYTLKAVINAAGNSVEFFVNGVSIGTQSDTLTIPTAALTFICGIQTTSGSAANTTFVADYVKLVQNFTVAR